MAGVERLGAGADAGLARLRGATRRPRARPRPGCGRARSSRRGTGASATRRPPFSAPSSRRSTPGRSCWRRHPDRSRPRPTAPSRATSTAPASASITQPTSRWYAKIEMKISKGHALVLLGRGRRSRRLPRDAAVAPQPRRATLRGLTSRSAGCDRRQRRAIARSSRGVRSGSARPAMLAARCHRCYGAVAYLVLPVFWTHYEHQKGLADIADGDADRRRAFPAIRSMSGWSATPKT